MILLIKTIPVLTYIIIICIYKFIRFKLCSTSISFTTVKVAADWASDSASDWAADWAADWASDSTHFNCLKVDFRKEYFWLFLRYFSLQMSVIMSNTTYLFTADGKLRKHARL